jgi:hypothetical protein
MIQNSLSLSVFAENQNSLVIDIQKHCNWSNIRLRVFLSANDGILCLYVTVQ